MEFYRGILRCCVRLLGFCLMSILRYQACSDPGRTGPIVNKEYLAFSTKSHGNRCFVCDSIQHFFKFKIYNFLKREAGERIARGLFAYL